jgi:hypothetical protein
MYVAHIAGLTFSYISDLSKGQMQVQVLAVIACSTIYWRERGISGQRKMR